ncbi:hypothetical protein BUALT_Bualt12G0073800 [Buddleja alternifolia]|uniref:signal-recognition-particle GTPase n=1 Tax=Buddleja alternifolia TaxID=168488 RepID=A0AAV6WWN3_9LAMI|nr:hypothetical protein BUALT_Bualt12G0073800 [Buddleja alternifolia]
MMMMDSMTNKELDSSNLKLMNESRIMRIARGCRRPVRDVMEMLKKYKITAKTRKRLEISKKGDMNARNMRNVLPPDMLRQLGGIGGLSEFSDPYKNLTEREVSVESGVSVLLGGSISRALQQMSNSMIIDEKVLNDCLNEITRALLQADVQFKLVRDMQTNIKKIVNLDDLAAGHNKRKIIQQAIFNELCKILDPGKPAFTLKKGKSSVVMFVGLQGSGKTTTCTKYAYYHQKKGWKPALVCVDTFRAGAFDQLKQNSTKAKIPFYGSYTESDPVRIAVEGVGNLLCIGQATFDQAQAFKQSVAVGAMIVTKMDGHAKGGGALSAVAATKSPVIFIGTGEHMDEFEVFNVKPFVSRLLALLQELSEGTFTLRNFLKMGPIVQEISMLPGASQELMRKELDSSNLKLMNESQIMRIARGCGCPVRNVMEMLEKYKTTAKTWKRLEISKKGDMNAQNMRNVLPPDMLKQFGGVGGLQNLMKKMCGGALRI